MYSPLTQLHTVEKKSPLKQLLYTIIVIAIIGTMVIGIAGLYAGFVTTRLSLAVVLGVLLLNLWLTWRNHLRIPCTLIPLAAFGVAVYQCVANSGIRDEAMFAFPLSIALSGLLLGQNGIIVFSILSILTISGMTYAEMNGLFTPKSINNSYGAMIVYDILITFGSIVFYIAIRNLNLNVHRLQQDEAMLVEDKQALMVTQAELEQKIIERTRNLEAARKEAEEANHALQAQMWQISGLAQLSDAMRGDQDIATLSDNILQHLCHYIDAATGALYVLEDNILRQTAGYALAISPESPVTFEIGEALVGEVARKRQPMQIASLPEDYMPITSALGHTTPRQLVILPFLYEERVVGVIEVGSLDKLTPAQMNFLQVAMENIAIAFNTVQTRTHIDQLLNTSRGSQTEQNGDMP